MVGIIYLDLFRAAWSDTDHPSLDTDTEYGVDGVDLLMPLDITFDRRSRSLDKALEETIHPIG